MQQAQITIIEARYQIERLDCTLGDKINILGELGISKEIVTSIHNELIFENAQKIKNFWNKSNISKCNEKVIECDKKEAEN